MDKHIVITDETNHITSLVLDLKNGIEVPQEVYKDTICWKYENGTFTFDEEKKAEVIKAKEEEEHHEEAVESQTRNLAEMFVASGENSTDFMERIDAQVLYSALMTDTLIESEVEVDE